MGRLIKSFVVLAVMIGIVVVFYLVLSPRTHPLAAAREAINRRDFPTARNELDKYLTRNPTDKEGLLLAARTARRDGDGPSAESYLQRYLDAGGSGDEAQLERVLRESQEGKVANADRVITHCTQNPTDPNAPLMIEALARGLLKVGPPTKAVQCIDLWLSRSISPSDRVQALVWRGQALQMQGLAPEAANDFQSALEINPSHFEARLLLAQFQIRDEPESALAHFRKLDKARPGDKDVQFGLASCYRQLGDLDAADKLLVALVAAHKDDVSILTEAGVLALDRGRPGDAEALLRRALAHQPRSMAANVQWARCLQDLGREAEAKEQLDRVKQLDDELFGQTKKPEKKP